MFNQDKFAAQQAHTDQFITEKPYAVRAPINTTEDGFLQCPWVHFSTKCQCDHKTHVVDVVWERDPREQDRRWLRLEVRCEEGRGYLLFIRNHGGRSYLDYALLDGVVSPFAEGSRW